MAKDEQAENRKPREGRDERGRMLPGHTANPNGRPRKIDLMRLARERFAQEEEGTTLEDAMWMVVRAMLAKGALGDTQAAKLVFEHFAERPDDIQLLAAAAATRGPKPPKDPTAFLEQMRRTASITVEVLEKSSPADGSS